jgi:hypothetical protein
LTALPFTVSETAGMATSSFTDRTNLWPTNMTAGKTQIT